MKQLPIIRVLAIVAFILTSNTVFAADETSATSAESSPGVVVKVKKAVEHAAKATAHGIERGANATAHGIKRGATATSNAAHKVAKKLTGSSDSSNTPSSSDE
jgi:hypothetical protein